jgi:hypothetical protein
LFEELTAGAASWVNAYWLTFVSWIICICFFIGFMIFFWWFYWMHPIEVRLYTKRGGIGLRGAKGTLTVKADIARVLPGQIVDTIKQMYSKRTIPMPDGKFLYNRVGIFRKVLLNVVEDDAGDLHPASMEDVDKLVAVQQNPKQWHTLAMREDKDLYNPQSTFNKYATVIVPIVFVMVFFVLMLILLFQIKDISAALHEVATALSSIPK